VGDDDALRHDPAAVPDLLDLGVDKQVRVAALERPLAEGLDLVVEQAADARDLGARAPEPERLDQLVDPPGRDAADIGRLDDRHERLLRALARPQEAREVAALPELGICSSISPARVSQRRGR
jgi:hypothetical protein